jgi:hypothetical protein
VIVPPPLLQDRTVVRETIDRILARREFQPADHSLSDWIGKQLERFFRWIGDLLGIADAGSVRTILMTFLVLAALGFAWSIVRALALRRKLDAPPSSAPAPDLRAATVDALRRMAREAADRGEHVAALRLLFRALVVGLSERGELAYREAWTNRELLERGAPRRDVLELLASLVPRLDAQSFGREPAGPDDVARLSAVCDRLLAAGATR